MTRKNKMLILAGILVLPLNCWLIYRSLTTLSLARDAREVTRQIVTARQAIEKMPPGFERVAEFIRRLKTVNPGHAAPEVKQALKDYTEAMEQAFDAVTNHADTASVEGICAQKAKALTDAINKNQ